MITDKVSSQLQNQAGPQGPAKLAKAKRVAHDLLIKPTSAETFTPKGQEKTHIGFVIRGTFTNRLKEEIQLPEIAFRIKKTHPDNDASAKELRVALLALNSFVTMHQHLSAEQFQNQLGKMEGQTVHFYSEENVESLYKPGKLKKAKDFFTRTQETKYTRLRFFVPDTMNMGRLHYMHKRARDQFINEHPFHEFNHKGVDRLAEALFEHRKPVKGEPKIHDELEEQNSSVGASTASILGQDATSASRDDADNPQAPDLDSAYTNASASSNAGSEGSGKEVPDLASAHINASASINAGSEGSGKKVPDLVSALVKAYNERLGSK